MQLIAEKKAAILREAADRGDEKEISGKSLVDRDLLTLLIKANMSTDIPDAQRLSDEDMLARASRPFWHSVCSLTSCVAEVPTYATRRSVQPLLPY